MSLSHQYWSREAIEVSVGYCKNWKNSSFFARVGIPESALTFWMCLDRDDSHAAEMLRKKNEKMKKVGQVLVLTALLRLPENGVRLRNSLLRGQDRLYNKKEGTS